MPPVQHVGITRRTAVLDDVAESLRAMLGLDPDEPAPGERAADLGRPLPLFIEGLDAGAWIAWCLTGLPIFSALQPGRLPKLKEAKASAGRLVVALAMLRSGGNLSEASRSTGTGRKVLRDNLRTGELYPWLPEETCDAHGREGR